MAQQITTSDHHRITSIVNRMGSAMARIGQQAERAGKVIKSVHELDLIDEGFDPEEIHLYATAARAVAARQL